MSIPFTQYLRPDGAKAQVRMDEDLGAEVEAKAQEIIKAGFVFECEVLTTGQASFTVTHPAAGDLSCRVCSNAFEVLATVAKMIMDFDIAEGLRRVNEWQIDAESREEQ